MNKSRTTQSAPAFHLGDIYFVLFRHKWKILIMTVVGILTGAAFYFTHPAPFQSEARLLIRYISDTHSLNPQPDTTSVTALDNGKSIMGAEMQILTSFDLAEEVVSNIGPEKILAKAGGGSDPIRAAALVQNNLSIDAPDQSSVLRLVFHHPDPAVVQPVLREIISDYLDKHLEVHQAIGVSDDFLTEETARWRSQISQTEDEIRTIKTNAVIVSADDAEKNYAAQITRISDELLKTQADLAEWQALLPPESTNAATNLITSAVKPIPPDELQEYQAVCARLDFFKHKQNDYLTLQGFTLDNKLVKEVTAQIAETARQKADLERKNPALTSQDTNAPAASGSQMSTASQIGRVLLLQSRVNILKQQLIQIQSAAADTDEAASKIADLNRKKAIQEANLEYYTKNLQQARIDEQLGPGRVSNISSIETPTPPSKDSRKILKTALIIMVGGLLGGVGWAFLIEFYLDTSVKRSSEVESKLKLPLFLSIPDFSRNGHKRLAQSSGRRQLSNGSDTPPPAKPPLEIVTSNADRQLHPFYDALRDRLVGYFENINLTRKPKLVAVTGMENGSGVSMLAAGLAASLSETGDGRVLLVDMNLERGAAQQFFQGKPGCLLDDVLVSEKREKALVQDNLYVVNEGSNTEKLQRVLPKRFASLVPKLKASDYDYIIFDMPPVSQTSVTSRLAGLMDMTLLVIESEKTGRDAVHQATALLSQSKATVGAVLNRTRKYVPERLHPESLGDI